jgi:translation initiation factor 1 (eIF-1/SUI1)
MSFNPFDDDNDDENDVQISSISNVTIWKEQSGRKTNTYITGWNIDINEMKDHLKVFKNKNGTNGSIKKCVENDEEMLKVQLQGDYVDKFFDFLVETGVNKDNIVITG